MWENIDRVHKTIYALPYGFRSLRDNTITVAF